MEQESRTEDVDRFGGCPECFGNDGFLNIKCNHWFICRIHRTRWCAGANLFGCWREETVDDWKANWEEIRDFTEVEPVLGPLVTLPRNVRESLQKILKHFLPDEEKDYKAREKPLSSRHIVFDLNDVNWWLKYLDGGDDV